MSKKMKIAVVIDTWFPYLGGGQINAWEISKRIAKGNIHIDIITCDNGVFDLKVPKNIRIIRLGVHAEPLGVISKLAFLVRSFFYLYSHEYDLIHAHAYLSGITARLIMVTKGIPAIFTIHGTSLGTKLLNPFQRFIEKFILTEILYSAQITVSQDFLNFKNINQKIFYIANGVDAASFDKVKSPKSKSPTLIFVGRLHPQKNLKTLISAVEIVKKEISDIKLLIVGYGQLKKELLELIRLKKLKNNIKLLGEKSGVDLIKLYKSSHIFILPSIYEGQPLTLLEAWAAKLPVIVTKTGDCQFLVKNGVNGYLIENSQDADEIAKLIKKFLTSKNLEKIGLNGYNLVAEDFSWRKASRETIRIYESFT